MAVGQAEVGSTDCVGQLHGSGVGQAEVGSTVVESGSGSVGQIGHSAGVGWVGQSHGSAVGRAEVVSTG